jgi:hypothetical protein
VAYLEVPLTTNLVTVNTASPGLQGTWLFAATGTLMDSNYVAIVAPVISGSIDNNGTLQYTNTLTGVVSSGAVLLASDNYPEGDLLWNFFGSFQGMSRIHVMGINVNFSAGPSQNLFSILAANGWTPQAVLT